MIRRYTVYQSQHGLVMTEVHELTEYRTYLRWDWVTATNDDFPNLPKDLRDKTCRRGNPVIGAYQMRVGKTYVYYQCCIGHDRHSQVRGY